MTEQRIIEIAKEFKINELIVNRVTAASQSIKYENGSFSEIKGSETDLFSIKAFIDGNRIANSISRPTEQDVIDLFQELLDESRFKTKEIDEHPIDTSSFKYSNPVKEKFEPLTTSEAQDVLKKLVQAINKLDDSILTKNTQAIYGTNSSTKTFISTTGTNLSTSPSNNFAITSVVYFDDHKEAKGTSYTTMLYVNKDQINIEDFTKEILKDIELQKTKSKIKSGDYEVVFHENAFMSLFSSFLFHLNARSVIDGISKWKDQVGKSVSSSKLNLIDAPIEKELGVYVTYDSDAYPTKVQHFIKDGILQKFVSNKKLSEILKVENSGNSNGAGASLINPYIDTGDHSVKEIISTVKNGVLARGFSGMHSGINGVSGEFSIELEGNVIKDGKIKEDIKGAVISGNFFKDVLPNVEMIANERNQRKLVESPIIKLSKKLPISA